MIDELRNAFDDPNAIEFLSLLILEAISERHKALLNSDNDRYQYLDKYVKLRQEALDWLLYVKQELIALKVVF